jgi:hypothetical protein
MQNLIPDPEDGENVQRLVVALASPLARFQSVLYRMHLAGWRKLLFPKG